jgi:hypothetical protein
MSQEELKQKQNEDLADLKEKFTITQEKYQLQLKEFPDKMQILQDAIDKELEGIKKVDEKADQAETETGLRGTPLVECLTAVRSFTKSHKDWAQMYAPLAEALKGELCGGPALIFFTSLYPGIQSMVKCDIQLLQSGDHANVFLAGKRLLRLVGFLSNYSASTRRMIESNRQMNAAALTAEFRMTLHPSAIE